MIYKTIAIITLLVTAAVGASLAVAPGSGPASAQSGSTIGLIGADAIIEGNTASSIGPRDTCVRADVGSQVTVDIVVDEIPADLPMVGFQVNVWYNKDLLEVVAANSDMMLGATGQYQPFPGLSDPLPDTDGDYLVVIADLASNAQPGANMESGKGVLTRVTFNVKAPGRSGVGPGFSGEDIYPSVVNPTGQTTEVSSIASTEVAIGEDCGSVPAGPQIKQLPSQASIRAGEVTPGPTGIGGGDATITPAPGTPTQEGQTTEPTDSPTPTTAGEATASATPAVLPAAGSDSSDTGMIVLAAILGTLGAALAAAGGFVLYQRARAV